MTKLFEWLTALSILLTLWVALSTNKIENSLVKSHPQVLLYSPIIFVFLFGIYAATVVLYRTFTFNNCEEAATELQKQIKEAKASLAELGYKFSRKQVK